MGFCHARNQNQHYRWLRDILGLGIVKRALVF